ncbi:MAG: hypothetical protein ABJA80_03745 [bacterium]
MNQPRAASGTRVDETIDVGAPYGSPHPEQDEVPMWFILSFAASTILAILAYAQSKRFVTRRLRYVDAVQSALAPFIAGAVVAVVALPLVAVIPLVGIGTALSLGLAVGLGVSAGAREVKHRLPGY